MVKLAKKGYYVGFAVGLAMFILVIVIDEFVLRELKHLSPRRKHRFLTTVVIQSFSSLLPLMYINLELFNCYAEQSSDGTINCRLTETSANFLNVFLLIFLWMKISLVPLIENSLTAEQFTPSNIAQLKVSRRYLLSGIVFSLVGIQSLYYFTGLNARNSGTNFDYLFGILGIIGLLVVAIAEAVAYRKQKRDAAHVRHLTTAGAVSQPNLFKDIDVGSMSLPL